MTSEGLLGMMPPFRNGKICSPLASAWTTTAHSLSATRSAIRLDSRIARALDQASSPLSATLRPLRVRGGETVWEASLVEG